MTTRPDVDAYLDRIGIAHVDAPTLGALEQIVAAHAATIPFENLAPFTGQVPALDVDSLQQKLVHDGRGGYCFEHNGLLAAVLEELGYDVTRLAARVIWGQPVEAITARSHMLVRVDLPEGPHLADVGFGGQVLTGVLRLETDVSQATPHERFRLVAEPEGNYRMEAEITGEWRHLYRFDLTRQHTIDYSISNWYLATHPESHFRTGLRAARSPKGRRINLGGRQLNIHHVGGETEQRDLVGPDDLRRALEDDLQIRVPADFDVEAAWARLG